MDNSDVIAALAGYAAAHPELEQFKNVGEPSVAIKNR